MPSVAVSKMPSITNFWENLPILMEVLKMSFLE
jgi:hypothetical protein